MFNWKEFEKIKNILSQVGGDRYSDEFYQHHLKVRPQDLLDWMELIKEDLGFFIVSEIAGVDRGNSEYEVVYHLLNMGLHQRLNLHLFVREGEVIPSIVSFFPHADWYEREQAEVLKLTFDRPMKNLIQVEGGKVHPLPIPALRFNPNKSETPYPEESYKWKKFDVLDPESMGLFEWNVCFDPLKVVDSEVQIGFHHQGFEKLLEKKDISQILQLVDKINLSSSPSLSVAWSKTVEEMFRIKIPERAQALRIVMLEMARVADHLTVLYAICREAKRPEAHQFLNAREKIYELFEKFSGHRHGVGLSCIGGVKVDLPHGWIVEYQNVLSVLMTNLRLLNNLLLGQVKFRSLLEGEPVNAQSVLNEGVSGPAMRAAGLNFDLRKSQPFYFYQDIDFDIPVGIHGTIYDRYLIRYEETFQSLRIITQVIDNLPLGEVIHSDFEKNPLELSAFLGTLERVGNWHYSALEAPAGEAGFLVQLSDENRPTRLKIKTPGFSLAGAMPIFVKGLKEEQLRVSLASLGLSRWEMDR